MQQRGRDSQSLSTDEGREARVREVTADVMARLAGVCVALPLDEVATLVRQIAEITVKYEALSELRAARVDTPPAPHPADGSDL